MKLARIRFSTEFISDEDFQFFIPSSKMSYDE